MRRLDHRQNWFHFGPRQNGWQRTLPTKQGIGQLLQTFVDPEPADNYGSFGQAMAVLGDNILVSEVSTGGEQWPGISVGAVYLLDGVTAELLQTFMNPDPVVHPGFGMSVAALGTNVLISATDPYRPSAGKDIFRGNK